METDFMGRELHDGDFVVFSRYGNLYSGIVKSTYGSFVNIVLCDTNRNVQNIEKRLSLHNYNIRIKSTIKTDVTTVHPEIQKFYNKIVKHTKGI